MVLLVLGGARALLHRGKSILRKGGKRKEASDLS